MFEPDLLTGRVPIRSRRAIEKLSDTVIERLGEIERKPCFFSVENGFVSQNGIYCPYGEHVYDNDKYVGELDTFDLNKYYIEYGQISITDREFMDVPDLTKAAYGLCGILNKRNDSFEHLPMRVNAIIRNYSSREFVMKRSAIDPKELFVLPSLKAIEFSIYFSNAAGMMIIPSGIMVDLD